MVYKNWNVIMLIFSFVSLLSCISSFPKKPIIDNPNDDYDEDGLTEVEGDCDDNNKDVTKIIWYVDGDGDGFGLDSLQTESCTRPEGYAEQIGDCDDSNSDVYPNAKEICDDIDNNCDEEIDDDDDDLLESSTFYFFEDKDGDGYGAGAAQNRCEAVPGLVGNQDDCDDESIRINPEASEICDDIDNDCDGLFDDEDDSLSGATTYYADGDGDGFGDLNQTVNACLLVNGYVENSLDCNDANPSITLPLWYLDNDGDGDGDINNTFENCEPPENYVGTSGDCDDNNPNIEFGYRSL